VKEKVVGVVAVILLEAVALLDLEVQVDSPSTLEAFLECSVQVDQEAGSLMDPVFDERKPLPRSTKSLSPSATFTTAAQSRYSLRGRSSVMAVKAMVVRHSHRVMVVKGADLLSML
jgi:hypothetical protein